MRDFFPRLDAFHRDYPKDAKRVCTVLSLSLFFFSRNINEATRLPWYEDARGQTHTHTRTYVNTHTYTYIRRVDKSSGELSLARDDVIWYFLGKKNSFV